MRQLLPIFLSAVAICAFATTTPAIAQETITSATRGKTAITAEQPNGLFAAVHAILAAPFDEVPRNSTETTQPEARCGATLDCSQNDYRGVP
jgi:hypothetical protein